MLEVRRKEEFSTLDDGPKIWNSFRLDHVAYTCSPSDLNACAPLFNCEMRTAATMKFPAVVVLSVRHEASIVQYLKFMGPKGLNGSNLILCIFWEKNNCLASLFVLDSFNVH